MAYTKHTWATGETITAANLNNMEDGIANAAPKADVAHVTDYSNAGAHNSIFRGKSLGTSITATQAANISSGQFTDLYVGDYWTINSVVYRIAGFDYYYRCGDTSCTTHHAVIVPDTYLYTAQMHNTDSGAYESGSTANTTAGGYAGSDMYTTNLEQAKTTIKAAFGNYLLSHRIYLTNAVTDGHPSAGAWYDSEVDLMNEHMVYGGPIFTPIANGSAVYTNYRVEKSQLPLFALAPQYINIRAYCWLRDVVSSASFAYVNSDGGASCNGASYVRGVRPAFIIS